MSARDIVMSVWTEPKPRTTVLWGLGIALLLLVVSAGELHVLAGFFALLTLLLVFVRQTFVALRRQRRHTA